MLLFHKYGTQIIPLQISHSPRKIKLTFWHVKASLKCEVWIISGFFYLSSLSSKVLPSQAFGQPCVWLGHTKRKLEPLLFILLRTWDCSPCFSSWHSRMNNYCSPLDFSYYLPGQLVFGLLHGLEKKNNPRLILIQANKTFAMTSGECQALKGAFPNTQLQLLKFHMAQPKSWVTGGEHFLESLQAEIHIPKIVEASLK